MGNGKEKEKSEWEGKRKTCVLTLLKPYGSLSGCGAALWRHGGVVSAAFGVCASTCFHRSRKSPGHTAAAAPRLQDRGCNGETWPVRQRNLGYGDKQESSAAQGCQLGHVGLEGAIITANLPRDRASSVSQLPTRSEGAACVIPSLPAEETWAPFLYCLLQALAGGRWEEANYTERRNCVFRPWGWGSARATPREGNGEPVRCQELEESLLDPSCGNSAQLSLSQPRARSGCCPALAAGRRRLGAGKRGTGHVLAPPSDLPSALPRDLPVLGLASSRRRQSGSF